jgi:predicted DNA-binding WGR domain protein
MVNILVLLNTVSITAFAYVRLSDSIHPKLVHRSVRRLITTLSSTPNEKEMAKEALLEYIEKIRYRAPPVTYLECKEGGSDKFYELKISGTTVTLRYGKRGYSGVTSVRQFDCETEAEKFVSKTLKAKLKKGYHAAEAPEQD